MEHIEYGHDIFSVVRTDTLSIEAYFTGRNNNAPLKIFDDDFSRFPFSIISKHDKEKEKGNFIISQSKGKNLVNIAATANIKLDKFAEIREKSRICYEKYILNSINGKEFKEEEQSEIPPCVSFKFNTPQTLKGKSPAQIIVEEDGKKILINQYNYLKEHLDKYPRNNVAMQAISNAFDLLKNGSLEDALNNNKTATSEKTIFNIYKSGPRPLKNSKIKNEGRQDNKVFCYEMEINYNFTMNYPVEIVIKNYFAPLKEKNKLEYPILKEKDSEVVHSIKLLNEEWLNAIDSMQRGIDMFTILNAQAAFKKVGQFEYEIRNKNIA